MRSSITGLVLSDVSMSFNLSAYADDIIVFVRSQQDVNKLGNDCYEDLQIFSCMGELG